MSHATSDSWSEVSNGSQWEDKLLISFSTSIIAWWQSWWCNQHLCTPFLSANHLIITQNNIFPCNKWWNVAQWLVESQLNTVSPGFVTSSLNCSYPCRYLTWKNLLTNESTRPPLFPSVMISTYSLGLQIGSTSLSGFPRDLCSTCIPWTSKPCAPSMKMYVLLWDNERPVILYIVYWECGQPVQ